MGQKVNPVGLRLGINRTWDSRWFADGADYGRMLHEDIKVRAMLKKRLFQPGLRLAMVCELVESVSGTTKDPATVLTAISQLQNGVWREESYIIAGRVFADRKIDKKAEIWMAGVKFPAMEQISLLYGISLGILERPVPALTSSSADGKEAEKPATGG